MKEYIMGKNKRLCIFLIGVCLLYGCACDDGEMQTSSQPGEAFAGTQEEQSSPELISDEVQQSESDAVNRLEPSTETSVDHRASFYQIELPDSVKTRITGISYPADDEGAQISYEELAYVHVQYYDFDGETQEGELVCNRAIAEDLVEIFRILYENQYPIEKIRLVDEYGGDDDASMADNNTSCFNYRPVMGTKHLSKHAYGLAIDVNPLYNPYITTQNGKTVILPEAGAAYADRAREFKYKIDENDLCYRLFTERGFTWGGSWTNSKDYQHFQKVL